MRVTFQVSECVQHECPAIDRFPEFARNVPRDSHPSFFEHNQPDRKDSEGLFYHSQFIFSHLKLIIAVDLVLRQQQISCFFELVGRLGELTFQVQHTTTEIYAENEGIPVP